MGSQDLLTQTQMLERRVPQVMPRAIAILPAYNEEEAITTTIADLRAHAPELDVLVVNDGSKDGTSAAARAAGAIVLDLPCNLGIGGAVQTGFKYAQRAGYAIALQFDGDGQHLASEIPKLLAPLLCDEADVALGSRFLGEGGFRSTALRRAGIYLFYRVNSWLTGQAITDNTSGFRAYSRETIAFLAENSPTDYPEPEAVVLLARNGFRLKEVAVEMRVRQGGRSSITALWSVYYMIKVVLAVLLAGARAPIVRRRA
ncbi:MAG TPA: glycosyltransferase family 2 protein [Oscillatoriaceae cyanobacterium]